MGQFQYLRENYNKQNGLFSTMILGSNKNVQLKYFTPMQNKFRRGISWWMERNKQKRFSKNTRDYNVRFIIIFTV